jgi:hypothetical protein
VEPGFDRNRHSGHIIVGLHAAAYPPDFSFGSGENTAMEFWVTVVRA